MRCSINVFVRTFFFKLCQNFSFSFKTLFSSIPISFLCALTYCKILCNKLECWTIEKNYTTVNYLRLGLGAYPKRRSERCSTLASSFFAKNVRLGKCACPKLRAVAYYSKAYIRIHKFHLLCNLRMGKIRYKVALH
jgi:hypothetical protein